MAALELTFCMIKPDATQRGLIGAILQTLESGGLNLKAGRLMNIDKALCQTFYREHQSKEFFNSLVDFICSGSVFVMALSGDNAVEKLRNMMGATDPSQAGPGTIRALYGESIERNSIHGSDSLANAQRELALFFKKQEIQ